MSIAILAPVHVSPKELGYIPIKLARNLDDSSPRKTTSEVTPVQSGLIATEITGHHLSEIHSKVKRVAMAPPCPLQIVWSKVEKGVGGWDKIIP